MQVWTKELPADFAATRELWNSPGASPVKQQAVFFLNSHRAQEGHFKLTQQTVSELFRLDSDEKERLSREEVEVRVLDVWNLGQLVKKGEDDGDIDLVAGPADSRTVVVGLFEVVGRSSMVYT